MPIKRRSRAKVEFSMASMTDLIFLLLIFFMITSSFVTPNALNLTMPKGTTKVVSEPNLTVEIDKDLNYAINGKRTSIENLPDQLSAELSKKQDPVIMLHADKSVPIDNVVRIMLIGRDLKAKVLLGTQPE